MFSFAESLLQFPDDKSEDLASMDSITTDRLKEYLKLVSDFDENGERKGIERFVIEEIGNLEFRLRVDLSTKQQKGTLVHTARNAPKVWLNVHTVYIYIKSLEFPNAPILLRQFRGNYERTKKPAKTRQESGENAS